MATVQNDETFSWIFMPISKISAAHNCHVASRGSAVLSFPIGGRRIAICHTATATTRKLVGSQYSSSIPMSCYKLYTIVVLLLAA